MNRRVFSVLKIKYSKRVLLIGAKLEEDYSELFLVPLFPSDPKDKERNGG